MIVCFYIFEIGILELILYLTVLTIVTIVTKYCCKQEAQLPQRDHMTCYVIMLVNLCCVSRGVGVRFQTLEVTHSIGHILYNFLLDFHCNYVSILHHGSGIITYFQKFKKLT